ncbi:unnamed protein product [Trypanosoma congolense IL3000]|uniref:WGS project CAEQ00000000 data, annotated contig 1748 n=1 Tax=Trypanosoma congolense (strain IL3000) TaxID=1068625 RepID=F9W8M4_TRYCI|nr:unnamed protein product [Trypanosoma congolense IL3000]
MLRKRYRPLDTAEERSVGVEQSLHVGLLHDEQSYCFRWPEAPLTSMLRRSDPSLALGMQSGTNLTAQPPVVLPQTPKLSHVATEHGKIDLFNSFSLVNPAISFSSLSNPPTVNDVVLQRAKRHNAAPPTASVDDNIFTFSATQLKELELSGVFDAFREAYYVSSASTKIPEDELIKRTAIMKMEEEIVNLEWRASQEAEKTSPAIKRILQLTVAVPFKGSIEGVGDSVEQVELKWKRALYDLWIKWRIEPMGTMEPSGQSNSSLWGFPLMPGFVTPESSKEYFMNVATSTTNAVRGTKVSDNIGSGFGRETSLSSAPGRRGAYGYLRWRIDLYEPRLRAVSEGANEHRLSGPSGLMGVEDVKRLIENKLPSALSDVRLCGRVDPLDAFALEDIRTDVVTWRQWLAYV